MIDTLYKEEILEHFRDPQNFGKLEKFSKTSKQLNPFCGDEIEMYVKFNEKETSTSLSQKVIDEISFLGKGCAISIASASMLTEEVKGKTIAEINKISDEDMIELLQVEVSETRKKCALLALAVLKDCL